MQGHIYQALMLVAFGNSNLRGLSGRPVWAKWLAFRFNSEAKFVDGPPKSTPDNPLLAADPSAWLTLLKTTGVQAIKLHHVPGSDVIEDYNSAVFGGGGRWLIETATAKKSDLWQSATGIVNRNAPDKRMWSTTFFRIAQNWQPRAVASANIDQARIDLASVLPKALAFARAHPEKTEFADYFAKGLNALSSATPLEPGQTSDFGDCPSLSLPAKQLIGAAGAAWVFGGMSWWNDGGVADPAADKEFVALSKELWGALVQALVAAVNSGVDPKFRG